MKRRMVSLLAVLALVLGTIPCLALADGGGTPLSGEVPYIDADGGEQQHTCTYLTAEMAGKTLPSGWYAAEGDVSVSALAFEEGETHLILADGCNLTVTNGLKTKNLTIYGQENGTGFLCAGNNSLRAPAIGDLSSKAAITINGGCVQAVSFIVPAGIAPYYVIGGFDGSTVTINGGIVAAHDCLGQERTFPQNCTANSSRGCIVARDGVGEVYGSMTLAENAGSGITLSSLHIRENASLNSLGGLKPSTCTTDSIRTGKLEIICGSGLTRVSTLEEIQKGVSAYISISDKRFTINGLDSITVTEAEGKDYTYTATCTKGTDTRSQEFILPAMPITDNRILFSMTQGPFDYTGSAITPAVGLLNGRDRLKLNTDYTVNYENNIDIGTGTVTVTGIGRYTGTITRNFTITDKYTYKNTTYIDETGTEQTVHAAILSGSNTSTEDLDTGWYVLEGAVSRKEVQISSNSTVHLILPDGDSLTLKEHTTGPATNGGDLLLFSNSSLTIYGQAGGSGSLSASVTNSDSSVGAFYIQDNARLTVNGGTIEVKAPVQTVTKYYAIRNKGAFTYNGESEKLKVTGTIFSNGTLRTERLTEYMIAVDTANLPVGNGADQSEAVKNCVRCNNPTIAGQKFTVSNWSGPEVTASSDFLTYTVTYTHPQRGNVSVEVQLEAPPEYTVTVENGDGGSGSASPSSAAAGTQITLTAAPDSGYHFKEWQVISGGVTVSDNHFTMPGENVTVKAVFEKDDEPTPPEPETYTVTVQTSGNGTASASPSSAAAGTEITLTAAPDSGYHFKAWEVVSGDVTVNDNRFTMPGENVTVKAVFEEDSVPVTGRLSAYWHSDSGVLKGELVIQGTRADKWYMAEVKKDGTSVFVTLPGEAERLAMPCEYGVTLNLYELNGTSAADFENGYQFVQEETADGTLEILAGETVGSSDSGSGSVNRSNDGNNELSVSWRPSDGILKGELLINGTAADKWYMIEVKKINAETFVPVSVFLALRGTGREPLVVQCENGVTLNMFEMNSTSMADFEQSYQFVQEQTADEQLALEI